jgi:hypothetical protein
LACFNICFERIVIQKYLYVLEYRLQLDKEISSIVIGLGRGVRDDDDEWGGDSAVGGGTVSTQVLFLLNDLSKSMRSLKVDF